MCIGLPFINYLRTVQRPYDLFFFCLQHACNVSSKPNWLQDTVQSVKKNKSKPAFGWFFLSDINISWVLRTCSRMSIIGAYSALRFHGRLQVIPSAPRISRMCSADSFTSAQNKCSWSPQCHAISWLASGVSFCAALMPHGFQERFPLLAYDSTE